MHSSKFFNRLLITGFVLVACCFFVQFNAHATTIIFSENFDSATPPGLPTNWVQIDISGTQGNWATNTSTVHPSGYAPHSSPNLAWFNSWTASSGSSTRLYYSLPIALPSDQYIELSFWMFHDGQYSNMDRIQVQFSNDGVTWYDVGSPILRYSAGSTEWREHSLDISAYAGQTILLGFLGISAYGNDIHIDDISISASPGYPLPSGAISWWMAEDNAYDSIGPNNGTLQGDATFADGKVGRAFLLDGTGDYITTSDSPDWDLGTGDFTIEAWINTPTPDATMRLIAAGTESAGAYQMWAFGYGSHPVWGTGSRLNFAYYNGSGYTDLNSYEINLTQDEWHHIAVVRSSTNLTFYFDGVEAGTQSIGSISLVGGGTGALIGARYALGSPTEFASGLIDEVSIYNRALSADEIADIYNFGSLGKYPLASLNVTKYGNGTVITNDLGINCGDDCIQFYYPGTAVCLIALPDAGYTFAGWTGDADCEDGILTMGYLTYVTCKAIFIKNPKVILLSPNGGEVLSAGVTSTIEWIEPANAHHYTLKLSMDNGLTWSTIASNITGNTYDWTVPAPPNNKSRSYINVIAFDSNNVKIGADRSDGPFTIEVIKLTSPNGGEALSSGTQHTITWTTNQTKKPVSKVILSYTLDGGMTWKPIYTYTGGNNPGSHTWTVPNVAATKTKCRVKVVLKDSAGNVIGSDVSDGFFTISPQ